MKVTLNPDKEVVARLKDGLKRKDGYCPCKLSMYVQGISRSDRRP